MADLVQVQQHVLVDTVLLKSVAIPTASDGTFRECIIIVRERVGVNVRIAYTYMYQNYSRTKWRIVVNGLQYYCAMYSCIYTQTES